MTLLRHLSPLASVPSVLLLCSFAPPAAKNPQADIDQAATILRQARDTQNPADFRRAGTTVAKALAVDPENFDAQRYQATALLGQQDLNAALTLAKKLNQRVPDDIGIWALLSEIHAARGEYTEAEHCAQWVLDLRRNSPLGFITAARLREVYGDYDGAAEYYSVALGRTAISDAEERSWLMVQSARVLLRAKQSAGLGALLEQAEKLFPGSLQVLEQKAELARANGEWKLAAEFLAKGLEKSPTPAHLYAYALLLDRAGMHDDANAIFARLETASASTETALIFYYADQKKNPERALALSTRRIADRQDIETLDAYAWALYRAGRPAEARTQIDKLLAIGTRDPRYVCHAGIIASHSTEGSCEVQ